MMWNLRTIFSDKVGKQLHYNGHQVDMEQLLTDQWGKRLFLSDPDIPLVKLPKMYNTTFHLYDHDSFALVFPGNTSVI